jgi:hypothetical protein
MPNSCQQCFTNHVAGLLIMFLCFGVVAVSTDTTTSKQYTDQEKEKSTTTNFLTDVAGHRHRRMLLSAECAKGTVNRLNSANCANCVPGFYTHNASTWMVRTDCDACPAGYYQDDYGKDDCKECIGGRFSNLIGRASVCEKCKTGTYVGDDGSRRATLCKYCVPGQYADLNELLQCKNCEPGKFAKDIGQQNCVVCEKGWYADDTASTACKACSPGRYQAATEASSCSPCNAGKYATSFAQFACDDCDLGRYSQSAKPTCSYCPSGKYQVSTNRT